MNIEDQLYLLYVKGIEERLEPLAKDFWEPIQNAYPLQEARQNFCLLDQDVYYAYLNDVLAKDEAIDIRQAEGRREADKRVAQNLFHDGFDYSRIVSVMTNSIDAVLLSKEHDLTDQQRIVLGTIRSVEAVNPIVSLPSIGTAKPLAQISLAKSSASEIYNSALAFQLKMDPSLRLREADGRVVRMLLHTGFTPQNVASCIKNSFNLQGKTEQEIMDFITLEKVEPHIPPNEALTDMDDKKLYQVLNTKIRELRDSKKMEDIVGFWQESIESIRQAFIFAKQTDMGAKIMRLWAQGISVAAKEFGIQPSQELKEVFKRADEISKLQPFDDDNPGWYTYYNIIDKLEKTTSEVFSETLNRILENPILRIPEVAVSDTLTNIIAKSESKGASPKALYYGAVKEIAINHPNIGIYEADKLAYKLLTDKNVRDTTIEKALTFSPRLSHLKPAQKRSDLSALTKQLEAAFKQPKEKGGR